MKKLILIAMLVLLAACSGKYDEFAKCMTEKDTTFYGAYWCPHCANQKNIIGISMEHINYVECSLPEKKGQTQVCIEANITTYPTWEFADGTRLKGVQQLETLSEKTGCELA